MTKQEFLDRIEHERPFDGSEWTIVVDQLIDSPYILGCYRDNGIWKIYETEERGGFFIIDQSLNESDAYNILYEQVKAQQELFEYINKQRN